MGRDFADPVSSMLVDLVVPVECTGIEHPQRSSTIRALFRALVAGKLSVLSLDDAE